MMLSDYTHENLISLLGFCNEGDEKILVICHDAAKGLCYLHEDKGNHHRVLHRDIKSSNIILDKNWKAKVSDMGLAKVGPANKYTFLITDIVGTLGYIDPMYLRMGFLTKESDVYSFDVVLFEVLCGRLCFDYSNAHSANIVHVWKQRYEENKLDEIMFKDDFMQALDPSSLEIFSEIAFQCLQESREKRPKMSHVVEKLEITLKSQELVDFIQKEYQEILKAVAPPLNYRSVEELKVLLSKGVLLNGGQTISRGRCYEYLNEFKARVSGQYLTPQISYTVNLVFRYRWNTYVNSYNPWRYKVDGEDEIKVFIIYPIIHEREDGWFSVPFYQFTSQHKTADLLFVFEPRWISLLVAGIEFQQSEEKVELQVIDEYQDMVKDASQSLFYTSLDELKQILYEGVHLNGYKTILICYVYWFSLNEKGRHCHMISMEDCLFPNEDFTFPFQSHSASRFPAGFYQTNNKGFKTHVKTQFLSPYQHYVDLKYRLRGESTTSTVYLANRKGNDFLLMAEFYQFTSDGSIVELEITFDNHGSYPQVEGILFQPLEKVS
ncbi:protein kinase-like domain, Phloem protein 2-like protein [Artemisia annua]|uniref:Protein kinase-like domain, Phloem protein 2-like protein n=1 Tax=Artemisia annua TaxID=35608 RepID=A0A2U1LD95_ARTAN|nr:protein kinase-like domain, Phloem protein 2-like protein [Artemisia annua]